MISAKIDKFQTALNHKAKRYSKLQYQFYSLF